MEERYDYPNLFDDYIGDSILVTDEWDRFRYLISEELKKSDYEEAGEFYLKRGIPFLKSFKFWIEKKLIGHGFKKEYIKEDVWFKSLIHMINSEQGKPYTTYRWDLNPPFGFPPATYSLSEDKHTIWFNTDVMAALLALQSIKRIQQLSERNGKVNIEYVKVYLTSLEMTINLLRAGCVPRLAIKGGSNITGGKTGGIKSGKVRKDRAIIQEEAWQAEAEKIWKKRKGFHKTDVAKEIAKNTGNKPNTIRKKIKKPRP